MGFLFLLPRSTAKLYTKRVHPSKAWMQKGVKSNAMMLHFKNAHTCSVKFINVLIELFH